MPQIRFPSQAVNSPVDFRDSRCALPLSWAEVVERLPVNGIEKERGAKQLLFSSIWADNLNSFLMNLDRVWEEIEAAELYMWGQRFSWTAMVSSGSFASFIIARKCFLFPFASKMLSHSVTCPAQLEFNFNAYFPWRQKIYKCIILFALLPGNLTSEMI